MRVKGGGEGGAGIGGKPTREAHGEPVGALAPPEVAPPVRRTSNADSNAPMLGINTALGYKPYLGNTTWQVPVKHVWSSRAV